VNAYLLILFDRVLIVRCDILNDQIFHDLLIWLLILKQKSRLRHISRQIKNSFDQGLAWLSHRIDKFKVQIDVKN